MNDTEMLTAQLAFAKESAKMWERMYDRTKEDCQHYVEMVEFWREWCETGERPILDPASWLGMAIERHTGLDWSTSTPA